SRPHSPSTPLHCSPTSLLPFPLFFFNDTATTEIYTLSLHDALPISYCLRFRATRDAGVCRGDGRDAVGWRHDRDAGRAASSAGRSEEHTSELQSLTNLVCRLLLEKKKSIAA